MKKISNWFHELDSTSTMILWGGSSHKLRLLFTYWKLLIKELLLVKLLGINLRCEKIFGFKVEFYDYSVFLALFKEIFVTRVYYVPGVKEDPVIVDCGSNIGMSVLFFKHYYPKSKITAFEPNPTGFAILKKNVENNRLHDVALHNLALHREKGSLAFYTDADLDGSPLSGATKQVLEDNKRRAKEIKVEAVKLSDYLEGNIDILKLDVEAAEGIVMEDIEPKLDSIKTLILDYNYSPGSQKRDNLLPEILARLEKKGFKYTVTSSVRPELLWNSRNEAYGLVILAYKQ